MKNFKPIFLINCIIIGLAILSYSCNRTKIPVANDNTLMLTLKDHLSGKYIYNSYERYSPSNVRKSNKTLNQYEVTFSCNNAKYLTLQDELTNDDNVIKFNQSSSTKIQSGTNDKFGKSKPIRDQK